MVQQIVVQLQQVIAPRLSKRSSSSAYQSSICLAISRRCSTSPPRPATAVVIDSTTWDHSCRSCQGIHCPVAPISLLFHPSGGSIRPAIPVHFWERHAHPAFPKSPRLAVLSICDTCRLLILQDRLRSATTLMAGLLPSTAAIIRNSLNLQFCLNG